MKQLIVQRKSPYIECFRHYDVIINGSKSKLAINKPILFDLTEDDNIVNIKVSIDWISNTKNFSVNPLKKDKFIINIGPNPIIIYSVLCCIMFSIFSFFIDWTLLRVLIFFSGLTLFLGLTFFRNKYFSITLLE